MEQIQYNAVHIFNPPLDGLVILWIQTRIGLLIYYAIEVYNKPLFAIITTGQQHALSTEATNAALEQMLDYVTTLLNYRITYLASDMVVETHSDAS